MKTAQHALQGMERCGGPERIIRGPRHPATQWPRAKASKPVQKPNSKVGQRAPAPEQPRQTESHERKRRSLVEVRALATTKIAIASLGPTLRAALARAEHLAAIPPVDKRIVDAEALIFEQELADLAGFRQEAETSASGAPVSALEAELSRVRAQVAQLEADLL